jgi:hypothetical protein
VTPRSLSLIAAALLLSALAVSLAAGAANTYPLPQHGRFQMEVPLAWIDEVRQPQGEVPPTIVLRPKEGNGFEVLVTPIWRQRPDVPPATKEAVRQSVQRAADYRKSQAVESSLPLIEFAGASGPGFYFSATDKTPGPGEYRYLTQGMLLVSELAVLFTILTNDGQEQVKQQALDMLKSAIHAQP